MKLHNRMLINPQMLQHIFFNKNKFSPVKVDNILGDGIGFIRFIECMGNDKSVVNAARISSNYGESLSDAPEDDVKDINRDRRLIRFLMKHKHTSPFEMCELKIHVKAPMFIARQWVRHRTANYNEYSARYSEMSNQFYYPSQEMMQRQSELNMQMSDGTTFDTQTYNDMIHAMKKENENSRALYEQLLAQGVARETARGVLPVSIYTEFYWKIDAHNLMHFLNLRCKPEAQQEIRKYALVILDFFQQWLPMTCEAFIEYIFKGRTLSKSELEIINQCIDAQKLSELVAQNTGMTQREKTAIIDLFTH